MSNPSAQVFQQSDPSSLGGVYAGSNGAPVPSATAFQRIGPKGPVLLQDTRMLMAS